MSETTYVPRAGSKAEAAIAALEAHKWLSAAELAEACECERTSIDGNIALAIQNGLIRRVARDGQAGFALGRTGDPPAREYEDDEAAPKRVRSRKAKPAPKKRAKPAKREEQSEPANVRGVMYEHAVGILEDGTVVVVDSIGHAIQISPLTARRIADLVARTS